jgi:predicted acyltransferase
MRYLSLDVFRGLTICLMIIVNSMGPGAQPYPILDHAEWFGFTFADFVFPSFLFAMGNSMAFSSATKLSNADYNLKAIKRTVLLFGVGLLLAWFPFFLFNASGVFEWKYFENLRFMGVLQRIALCYLIAALVVRYLNLRDIFIVSLVLLFGYWGLLVWGAPSGMAFNKAQNFGSVVDNFIIPKNHIFRRDDGFEPEGLLGTLPAVVNVLAGYLAAVAIQNSKDKLAIVKKLVGIGILCVIAANVWAIGFPISKKLWTSSFVVLCNGLDLILLAALIFGIEIRGQKIGSRFFEIFGKNPLAIYVFSIVLLKIIMVARAAPTTSLHVWLGELMQSLIPGPLGSLIFAIIFMLVCWGFGLWLDKKRIIIKL